MSLVSVVIYHRCQLLQCQRVFVPLYNVISPPWFCNCWDGKFSHYYVYSVSKLDIFRLAAAALCIIDTARIVGAAAACGGFAAERHAVRRYRSLAGAALSSTYGQCHDDSWRKGLKQTCLEIISCDQSGKQCFHLFRYLLGGHLGLVLCPWNGSRVSWWVCRVSVCLCVCCLAYVSNHTSKLHWIFFACCLRQWLGVRLAWLRCVVCTFGFVDDVTCAHSRPGEGDTNRAYLLKVTRQGAAPNWGRSLIVLS